MKTKTSILPVHGAKKKIGWCLQDMQAPRMEIDGGEIRMLNDDEVLGVISDPEDILFTQCNP
jgi:hypothetical protein